jgi:hypothetical protein
MPFQQDQAVAEQLEQFWGKYHSTFRSEHEQVIAHLFEREGWLIAHVFLGPSWDERTATDDYFTELRQYAKDHGFEGKLQIRHSA